MTKGEYVVFLLLLIFLAYGFIGREALVPKRAQVGLVVVPQKTEKPVMNPSVVPESDTLDDKAKTKLEELKKELEEQVVKIRIVNWLTKNADTMLLLRNGSRAIERVCFADVSVAYVEFLEGSVRGKWLLSLHNIPQGFFPEFKAFFSFEHGFWQLNSGEDTHKGIPLDCYMFELETSQWKQE